MNSLKILRKRLLYQSHHRGMREMDFLLGGFAHRYLESMDEEEMKQFESFLAIPDQTLYGWFFERIPFPEDAPKVLIKMIQDYLENL